MRIPKQLVVSLSIRGSASWLDAHKLVAPSRTLAGIVSDLTFRFHPPPLNWTASKTDKLDLLLTSTAVSLTSTTVSLTHRCFFYAPLFQFSVLCFFYSHLLMFYLASNHFYLQRRPCKPSIQQALRGCAVCLSCWEEYHWLSSFEWKAMDQSYCSTVHSSMRWKWLGANYSSWIFDEAQPITGLYRSILLQCMAIVGCRKSVIEICLEIRRRNPLENVSRNVISVPLVRWNRRDTIKRDWLTKEAGPISFNCQCNPQMFGSVPLL